MNVFSVLRCLSTDLIPFTLGDQHKSFAFCHCYYAAGSMYGSTGCSVRTELCERVTSTCVGLVSNNISLRIHLENFTTLADASDGMRLYRMIAKMPV